MNKLLLAAAALLVCAVSAHAGTSKTLYSEPEEGTFIVRDAELAQALRDGDSVCERYSRLQDAADQAASNAAAHPAKKTLQREKMGKASAARHAMAECLEADKASKRALQTALKLKTLDRLQKAAPFEDMVFVQLLPASADHYEALR